MSQFRSALFLVATAATARADWTAVPLGQPGESFSHVFAVSATQQGGSYRPAPPLGVDQAGFWSGTGDSWTALYNVSPYTGEVYGIDGGTQVGDAAGRAVIWHGTPESRIDLAPTTLSEANAVRGNMQVGEVYPGPPYFARAAVWRGTAASMVSLHPAGASESWALATDGSLQGGRITISNGAYHAALWNGTADSFLDLNPPGALQSTIYGMAPGVQVGYYTSASFVNQHAAAWSGTAQSMIDFNPPGDPGAWTSFSATTGTVSVGDWGRNGYLRAAINFGTPTSWVSLHDFLPPGFSTFSHASSIYQDGNTLYVGGWAYRDDTHEDEAMLWIGTVPAPGSAALLAAVGALAVRRRRSNVNHPARPTPACARRGR